MAKDDTTVSISETITTAFGAYPDDVLGTMRTAVKTLSQLEAMFAYIKSDLESHQSPLYRAKELASAGAYLASDISNMIDCQREEYQDCLAKAGVSFG